MECTICGKELADEAHVCPSCNTPTARAKSGVSPGSVALPMEAIPTTPMKPSEIPTQPTPATSATTALGFRENRIIAGRFEVQKVLGQGGMGRVYRGFDRQLERTVAIKRLLPQWMGNSNITRRFVVEAKSVAALNHPNVVGIYDIARDDLGYFIIMEFVEGESLAERISREGAISVTETIRMLLQVGRALQSAHERGVIHRDIKPANILVTSKGVPKLADFGLAQLATSRESDLTKTGSQMGTWHFASPEQMADAKHVDRRTDIYSCGAMMYQMLTGELPRHIREVAIPDPMRLLVMKCLAHSPADRFQSADEMVQALSETFRRISGAQTVPPPPAPTPRPVPMPRSEPRQVQPRHNAPLWKAHRSPWSRPVQTSLGAALFVCSIVFADLLQTQVPRTLGALNLSQGLYGSLIAVPYDTLAIGLSLLYLVVTVLSFRLSTFCLTETHLVHKHGLLIREASEYPLEEIADVGLGRGLFGTLLGYGELRLIRPGQPTVRLQGVSRPGWVHGVISEHLGRFRSADR